MSETRWDIKYPLCFAARGCCIEFGIECEKGWYPLIERLIAKIEVYLTGKSLPFQIDQIKEKYGTLRFYVSGADDQIYNWIDEAELESGKTCEQCGKPGVICHYGGWFSTRCPDCREGDNYIPFDPNDPNLP